MTNTLPTVTARGVLATTRTIFMLVAALLAPALAQYLFGPHVAVGTWGMFAFAGAAASLAVSRLVVSGDGSSRPAARVFLRGALVGLVAGVVTGVAWVMFERPSGHSPLTFGMGGILNLIYGVPLGALFGAIYGVPVGAAFGAAFALFTRRARAALARPSAVASQRLAMEGGLLLSVAGALGLGVYRIEALSLASAVVGFAGVVVIVAAVARVVRMQKLFTSVTRPNSGFVVAPNTPAVQAPALVWSPVLDQVIVRATDPASVDPAPFRTHNPASEVAVVPADLSIVRRAIGAAIAFGFVAVVGAGAMQAGAFALNCCGSCSHSAGCGGCTH